MKDRYEDALENLNLVYRLKEQAEAARYQSELMLRGVRAVLDADSPDDLYQRMFSNFHDIVPYNICLILEQSEPGFMLCSSSTRQDIVGTRWAVGDMLRKVIGGKTIAMYNAPLHPQWCSVPLPDACQIKSLLFSPFLFKNDMAIIVFAHQQLGFYTQQHIQIATRYREFTEQTLLSVNARLQALESAQLKRDKARVEQSLIDSEKMASVGLLAAGVAHEINNPVGFISSNIEYLKQSVPTLAGFFQQLEGLFAASNDAERLRGLAACQQCYETEQIAGLITDIEDICNESDEGLQRVADITTSLKSFTRADPKTNDPFCVNQTINDTLPLVNPELKHHVKVNVSLNEVPTVLGSSRKLSQVLINLLVNAGQAIHSHGEINLSTDCHIDADGRKWVVITVADNGCGISQHAVDKIFQPFFTTKPVGQGTGLGLYISLAIMKSMGGDIQVVSRMNQGTTFSLFLPDEPSRLAQSGAS